jgi:plasmid maintenance system antidote protein VapI
MITKNNKGCWSTYKPNKLFDHLREMYGLKTDSQLAYLLSTRPPIISRIRNGALRITPALIIEIHEQTNMPIARIKEMCNEK